MFFVKYVIQNGLRLVLCLCGVVLLTMAAAAQETKIKGVLKRAEPDGRKLPVAGITVQIAPLAAPDKVQESVTDDEGRFTFADLIPGDYVLSISATGFEEYKKTYKIIPGAAADLDIDLKVKATSDTVTVNAGDTEGKTETSSTNTLGTRVLRNAPLVNENFQDALPLVPGVVRGPDGLLNLKGARTGQSGLLVNSTNVTDPATGNFAISVPLEAIQSVTVLSSPYSAEYGKFTGAVASISTRSGGDHFRFLFTNFFIRPRRRTVSLNPKQTKLVGIESATPRLVLSGPIIKGKLTFSQSFQYQYVRTLVPSQPFPNSDTTLEAFDSFTQVDYDANRNNHLTFVLSFFPQNLTAPTLNTFNPLAATPNFRQRGFFTSLVERAIFSNGSVLEVTGAFKRFNAFVFPQGNLPFIVGTTVNGGNFFNRQDRYTDRAEGQVVYNFAEIKAAGSHFLKLGMNISGNTLNGRDRNTQVRVTRQNGTLNQAIDFVGAGNFDLDSIETTAFVQDRYTVSPRVTLDFGVRFDRNGLSREANIAPRFGFVIVPSKTSDATVIRGGVGLFYDKVPLAIGAFPQFQSRSVRFFAADGVTQVGPTQAFFNRFGNELSTPRSVSASIELDRRITKKLLFRIGYQQREGRDEFIVNPDPTGSGMVVSNGGRSRYREFQATARYRFGEVSDVMFSYVRSKAEGNLNDFNGFYGNFRPPVIRGDQYGRLAFDAPNRFLVTANVDLPFGLVASPVLDIHTGFPYSQVNENQDFVGRRNPDNLRLPQFVVLDLQVTKRLMIPFRKKKIPMRVGVKVFNVTNHFNPRDVQSNIDSPFFGTFYNSVRRSFRGKFEFDF